MKRFWMGVCFSASLALLVSPTVGDTKRALPGEGQNSRCEAQCREAHQGNAAALQACLRDCGAIEPAGGHSTTPAPGNPGKPTAAAAEASNLNLSKSNVDRKPGSEEQGGQTEDD